MELESSSTSVNPALGTTSQRLDGLLTQENSDLRDRVSDLEQRIQSQSDELLCLKSALSDCLRRLAAIEASKGGPHYHVPSSNVQAAIMHASHCSTELLALQGQVSPGGANGKATTVAAARKAASASASGRRAAGGGGQGHTVSYGPPPVKQASGSGSGSAGGRQGSSRAASSAEQQQQQQQQQQQPLHVSVSHSAPARRPMLKSHSLYNVQSPLQQAKQANEFDLAVYRSKDPVWVKDFNKLETIEGKKEFINRLTEEGILRIYMRGRAINLYAPSDLAEQVGGGADSDIRELGEAPASRLKLEWVYGYRGRDCRSNLYFLPTGEMVYFVASVVVLHNVEEGMQRHYTGHNDDVKSIAVHPDRVTMATGQVAGHDKKQGKPHVRVWSSVDLSTLHVLGLGDFERAVSCLSFSKADGGTHLCAIDDANEHVISVWDWRKGHKVTETKTSTEPVLACEYHPLDVATIITCGKNQLTFWSLEGCQLTKKNGIFEKQEKPKFVLCLAFAQNGDLITGDSNGSVLVWPRGGNRISQAVQGAHDGGIFSLCVMKDDSLVSGGKDRRLLQWDSAYNRTGAEATLPEQYGPIRTLAQGPGNALLVGTTRNCVLQGSLDLAGSFSPIVHGHSDELWGLACHPSQLQFVTAAYDKSVCVWDALTRQAVWSKEVGDPAHCAAFHPTGETIAVGCQGGRWYVLDSQRRDIAAVHTDGSEQIECVEFSPDGSMLALGSRDNSLYVYACTEAGRKYSRIGRCCGHSSFITHLDWSLDGAHLRSNSGDYELLFWTSTNCRQVSSPSSLRDTAWASQRCTLSFHTAGIWPEGADGTDVNACDRSLGRALLASGDDFGQVCLYRHPCYQPRSKGHASGGHSSHVTNVRFLRDDSRLLSTGGKDTAVLQWEIV